MSLERARPRVTGHGPRKGNDLVDAYRGGVGGPGERYALSCPRENQLENHPSRIPGDGWELVVTTGTSQSDRFPDQGNY
jgi:hypothetical protein